VRTCRTAAVLLLVCAALSVSLPRASAGTITVSPRDSTSKLAIKSVSDRFSGEFVTYHIETYDGWDNVKDISKFQIYFDVNGKGNYTEMCIILEPVGDGRLRSEFYPKCGQFTWSTSDARKPAPNVVEFEVRIRDLILGGGVVPGRPFRYRVYSECGSDGGHDWAPASKDAYVMEQGLPHLTEAQLYGEVVASRGNPTGREFQPGSDLSGSAANGRNARRFSPFGGLPLGTVLIVTLIILVIGYFAWRLLAKRFLVRAAEPMADSPASGASRPEADDVDGPVHFRDT